MVLEEVYNYSNFILKVIILNILWFLMSIIGVVIFGIIPSTLALMKVMREELISKRIISTGIRKSVSNFFKYYKENFVSSNKKFLVYVLLLLLLLFNIENLTKIDSSFSNVMLQLSLGLRWFLIILISVMLGIETHYEIERNKILIKSIYFIFLNPIIILIIFIWAFVMSKLFEIFPFIAFIIGNYLYIIGIVVITFEFFKRNDQKFNNIEEVKNDKVKMDE